MRKNSKRHRRAVMFRIRRYPICGIWKPSQPMECFRGQQRAGKIWDRSQLLRDAIMIRRMIESAIGAPWLAELMRNLSDQTIKKIKIV